MLYSAISRPVCHTHIPVHVRHSSNAFSPDLLCIKFHHTNTYIGGEELIITYLTGEAVTWKSAWGKIHHLPSQECCIFVWWLTRHFKGWYILYSRWVAAKTCYVKWGPDLRINNVFLNTELPWLHWHTKQPESKDESGLTFVNLLCSFTGGT